MRRAVLIIAVAAAIAAVVVYLQRGRAAHVREAASLVPASAIFFDDMPDIRRTRDRWPQTDLCQLWREPEVQAFLEQPLKRVPHRDEIGNAREQVGKVDPLGFFAAVTEWTAGRAPKAIVGLRYGGKREDLDVLVGQLRGWAQTRWPEGKTDVEKYGAGEIETFGTPSFAAALAYRGDWLLVATDEALLKETLDRMDGHGTGGTLAEDGDFRSCLGHLPMAPDNVFFMRPGALAEREEALALMVSPTVDTRGLDAVKKIRAASGALKMEGPLMRDALYVMKDEPGNAAPLARNVLRLSSGATIVALDDRLEPFAEMQLPDGKADPTGMVRLIASYAQIFKDSKLGASEFQKAFGPEAGFVIDWSPMEAVPSMLAMIDVKDEALARRFLDTLTTLPLAAGVEFDREDGPGGVACYCLPRTAIGFFPLQVTLGLGPNCVVAGLSKEAAAEGIRRRNSGEPGLGEAQAFRAAAALVQEPSNGLCYVDAKAIFERLYGLARSVAAMGFVPHLADYVDVGKLPQTGIISRHLGQIVSSSAVRDGGVLAESAGPLTMTQGGAVVGAVVMAAAVPIIEQQLRGGGGFSLPGSGGGGLPPRITTPLPSVPSTPGPVPSPGGP